MSKWNKLTIGEMCDVLDNQRIPLNEQTRQKMQGRIPYYGANGLQGYINDFLFDEDLILIAEDGGYFDEYNTRPITYRVKGKSWVNNHAHILRAKSKFDQDYIFYSLVHKNILKYIQGGTRAKLNQKELREILIDIPEEKPEQSAIANILTTVDKAIETTGQLIAKYERIKTGMMQDLLTKGIDENGEIRYEKTHKFKDSPLGKIPQEWEVKRVDDISNVISGGTPKTEINEYWNGEICWITPNDLSSIKGLYIVDSERKITKNGLDSSAARLISGGSIVISTRAPIGYMAIVKQNFCTNQGCKSLELFESQLAEYHLYNLRHNVNRLIVRSSGSTFLEITKTELESIEMKMPKSKEEMIEIARRIVAIEEIIKSQRDCLNKLNLLSMGLRQDLIKGRVFVPEEIIKKITEQAFIN
jgi:type I restriction enzyme S subunit